MLLAPLQFFSYFYDFKIAFERQRQDAALPKRPELNVPNPYLLFNPRTTKCRIFGPLPKLLYLKVTSVDILLHYQEILGTTFLKVLREVLCLYRVSQEEGSVF